MYVNDLMRALVGPSDDQRAAAVEAVWRSGPPPMESVGRYPRLVVAKVAGPDGETAAAYVQHEDGRLTELGGGGRDPGAVTFLRHFVVPPDR